MKRIEAIEKEMVIEGIVGPADQGEFEYNSYSYFIKQFYEKTE